MTEPVLGRRERRRQSDAVLAFLAREGLEGVPEADSKRHRRLALLGGIWDVYFSGYENGSSGWRKFEDEFRFWVRESTSLTPPILIALYPHIDAPSDFRVEKIHDQVRNLSAELGVETIDLIDSLTEFEGSYSRMYASPFDAYPSADVHHLIAEALYSRVQRLWPELIASGCSP